jgi:glycine dehydrogenase subunit 1
MLEDVLGSPYIPNTEDDRAEMLEAIGVNRVADLFADIPLHKRTESINLPQSMSELTLRREFHELAGKNVVPGEYAMFLGAGVYNHFIPSAIAPLISRGEFLTSYTPYQPEVSQGTLQATYEFQSLISLLTGMDNCNSGMYDGATALAEGVLMACRVTRRSQVIIADSVPPRHRSVILTYTKAQGIDVKIQRRDQLSVDADIACVVVASPNYFGYIDGDMGGLANQVHDKGALLVVSTNVMSLGILKPPGEYDADIVTGECQPLGIPLSFGGPYVGFFASKDEYVRQMPGRIVGKTVDTDGRTGYVLTLQTREQHIRRERATSNICTSEALIALRATIYLALMGKRGFAEVGLHCFHKAHYLASLIQSLPNFSLPFDGDFFNEFVVRGPAPSADILKDLEVNKIIGGLDISDTVNNGILVSVTEMNTKQEIHKFVEVLSQWGGQLR